MMDGQSVQNDGYADAFYCGTLGTRNILPEYGSFTLLPGGYPLTSTYLPGSAGL
jgi:hypothetical protein